MFIGKEAVQLRSGLKKFLKARRQLEVAKQAVSQQEQELIAMLFSKVADVLAPPVVKFSPAVFSTPRKRKA